MNIPQNPNGQATGANSTPTVLASDTGLPTGSNTIGNINLSTAITTGVTVLQNAAVATSNGTSLIVTGYGTAVLQITGSFSATINFEFSTDAGTTWNAISATQIGAGDIFQSTTIPGSFRITCTALDLIRARVTWVAGTSITINGRASNAINATKVVKLATGINTIGTVNIATAQTIATVSAVTAITNALPVGANTIGAVTNANLDVALSTRLKSGDTLAAVTTVGAVTAITNALPVGANKIGIVDIATAAATAKGTQGTNALPTQDLKDAGRNQIHYYTLIPVLSTATDTLQSLTGTKANTTVTATATPAVVTTGKTFRVTRLAATYIATTISGYGIVRLRYQPAGVVTITSPIAATLLVGAGAPTTANSTASEEATLDEGWEFAAATGVGISVQGFAGVTATAVGYVLVSITGYEY